MLLDHCINNNIYNSNNYLEKFNCILISNGFVWAFTGVYGPLSRDGRTLFQEELGAEIGLWEEPWCVAGDFNVNCFPFERSRVGRLNISMRRFSEVIDEMELVDLPLSGGNFNWRGGC